MAGALILIVVLLAAFFGLREWGNISMTTGSDTPITPAAQVVPNSKQYLSASQIYQLAVAAGFSGIDAVIATAVALAESAGDYTAYNPETAADTPEGLGSYGLWQIYAKVHTDVQPPYMLYDPPTNAQQAFLIYQDSTFRAWSTYKNGAYNAHLETAAAVANDGTVLDTSGQGA